MNILYRIQKKEGGSYQKKSGCIRRIDTYLNEIVLQSGDRIPLDEIVDIDRSDCRG